MRLFLKPSNWLLLILGTNSKDIEIDVNTNITRAAQIIGLNAPIYNIQFLNTSKTKTFPTGITSVNEIEEEYNEKILNDLIIRKKKSNATKVALVMERNAFPSDDIFEDVVKKIKHNNSIYYLICSKGNFLATEERKKCYRNSCDRCSTIPICEHSCLLRLLWVMFEDERILAVLDNKELNSK